MALILLRHTQPDIAPGICYGQTDLDVAASFEAEATSVLAALSPIDQIVTSPLRRCQKLASFIGNRSKLDITRDDRLMEMDFGTWVGRPWSDIPRPEIDAWAADFLHARPHGGESVATLQKRTLDALSYWQRDTETTLIVTHAGIVRAALATGETADHFNAQIDFGEFVTIS